MASHSLSDLFHRRWAVPAIAALYRTRGAKLVSLVSTLGATRAALKQTLAPLIRMGLVMRNPGYGHPMRPEYLLTARGMQVGPGCCALVERLEELGLESIGLKKWSMPVLAALDKGQRFGALRAALPGLTDRALTLALKNLTAAELASRLVMDGYPPTTFYQVTEKARPVVGALEQIRLGFPPPRPAELKTQRRQRA
jgi:DNA-binding HxlR family transcriptional regulator